MDRLIGAFLVSLLLTSAAPAKSGSLEVLNKSLFDVSQEKIENQYIVSVTPQQILEIKNQWRNLGVIAQEDLNPKSKENKFLKLTFASVLRSGDQLAARIAEDPRVEWISPNYLYSGNLFDAINNVEIVADPQVNDQYHHTVMKNFEAWDIEKGGQGIVVAVTDTGVDFRHEDLASNIAINQGEIPQNGIDDDHNGYVDDVMGWNARQNNPDVSESDEHGTHVIGIVAAVANNGTGVAGTANGTKFMPIKIYDGTFDSATLVRGFTYAVDNGAKIITTSYNVDGMVTDLAYRQVLRYAYSMGVLLFNSAGNNNAEDSPRTQIGELLLVCSTVADNAANDTRSSYSNYGSKVHLCASGGGGRSGILSTLPNNRYGRMSGTSMASPNAAAVAALIWSHHPDWSRAQVVAQLLGSADNIDELNPGYRLKLGSGRVNSLRAVTEQPRPIAIRKVNEINNGIVMAGNRQFTILLSGAFDTERLKNVDHWQLRSAGPDSSLDTSDDISMVLDLATELTDLTRVIVLKSAALSPGKYRLAAAATLHDPFGTPLDGNGDGTPGDNWSVDFTVQ